MRQIREKWLRSVIIIWTIFLKKNIPEKKSTEKKERGRRRRRTSGSIVNVVQFSRRPSTENVLPCSPLQNVSERKPHVGTCLLGLFRNRQKIDNPLCQEFEPSLPLILPYLSKNPPPHSTTSWAHETKKWEIFVQTIVQVLFTIELLSPATFNRQLTPKYKIYILVSRFGLDGSIVQAVASSFKLTPTSSPCLRSTVACRQNVQLFRGSVENSSTWRTINHGIEWSRTWYLHGGRWRDGRIRLKLSLEIPPDGSASPSALDNRQQCRNSLSMSCSILILWI